MYAGIVRQAYQYWFGELPGPDFFPKDKAAIWFERSDETDRSIRETFGPYLDGIAAAAWHFDDLTREERVGLVIFLDQFPRNMFRDSPRAFAYDLTARGFTETILNHNLREYFPIERVFVGMPLVHSESLADQERAVSLMKALVAETPGKDFYPRALERAMKHRDLIARFGRFPHRNADLGRPSTPEEIAFAQERGRGY